VTQKVQAGNVYVNRNVIGAVVGVQPFGGIGLSGTGPKAGGPLYLYRLLQASQAQGNRALAALPLMPVSADAPPTSPVNSAKQPALLALQSLINTLRGPAFAAIEGWRGNGSADLAVTTGEAYLTHSVLGQRFNLPGPTGEANHYQLLPRGAVWGMPQSALGLVQQVAAALASGNPYWIQAPIAGSAVAQTLAALPIEVLPFVQTRNHAQLLAASTLSALLFEGDGDALQALAPVLAQRPGAIIRIESLTPTQLSAGALYDVSALMHEQSISTNTAAAGGNAQLMTLG
jgi:RHH-type proline utilization regulon transcriptional repressor/proline dehydrogenase/delta 1-pyrroline-5-carboxylate dehydrogenase